MEREKWQIKTERDRTTRVVITGTGCITAIGQDVSSFSTSLFSGVTGIKELDGIKQLENLPLEDLRFSKVAAVRNFQPNAWIDRTQQLTAERSSQFALAAGKQAILGARLLEYYKGEDIAVILGCSTGGRMAEEPEIAKLYMTGARIHPLTVPRAMSSSGTSHICIEYHITGPAYTVSTACASSAHAIGQAFHMVRSGMVKAAVAGGHDAPLTYAFLKSWESIRAVSPTSCKPFSAQRDGMTLGEGAAIFTLETMETALERGVPILAEVVGFGMSSDASHMTQGDPSGAAAAMSRALHDAQASPDDVGYINAHGTGTELNDRVEAAALHEVFGDRAKLLPISSTKSLHGHSMGSSGAIEFLATILALQRNLLPAAAGIPPDKTLKLDGLLIENRECTVDLALSNSFAFGGLNGVLALRRF